MRRQSLQSDLDYIESIDDEYRQCRDYAFDRIEECIKKTGKVN